MASRIKPAPSNCWGRDQAIYYDGPRIRGHVLDLRAGPQGRRDLGRTTSNVGMGARCLRHDGSGRVHARAWVEAGPTRSGHRTPAIYRPRRPVNGTDESQCALQRLAIPPDPSGRGRATASCSARPKTADATSAFVEVPAATPPNLAGVDAALPLAGSAPGRRGAAQGVRAASSASAPRGRGLRGDGGHRSGASASSTISVAAIPGPLNPEGELLAGRETRESEGIANCEAILDVPGLGFRRAGAGRSRLCRWATAPCRANPSRPR